MPLQKLTDFTKKVSDLADKPNATMTASEVKAQFDAAPDEVRIYLNQLIDSLQSVTDGDSGADGIGVTPIATSPGTLQGVLEWLNSQISSSALGQIPDGAITDIKLSAHPDDIKQTFATHKTDETTHGIGDKSILLTAEKTSVVGALNELFTNVSDGKALVGTAITDLDSSVVVPTDPTFNDLSTAIGSISTGKKWAQGSASLPSSTTLTVTGLTFKPSIVLAKRYNDSSSQYYSVFVSKDYFGTTNNIDARVATGSGGNFSTSITNDGFSGEVPDYGTWYWVAIE